MLFIFSTDPSEKLGFISIINGCRFFSFPSTKTAAVICDFTLFALEKRILSFKCHSKHFRLPSLISKWRCGDFGKGRDGTEKAKLAPSRRVIAALCQTDNQIFRNFRSDISPGPTLVFSQFFYCLWPDDEILR